MFISHASFQAKLGKKKKSSSTVYRDRYREKGPGDPDKPPPKKRGRKPKHLAEVKTEVDDTKEYFWFPDASSGHVRDLTKLYQVWSPMSNTSLLFLFPFFVVNYQYFAQKGANQ